MFFCLSLPGYYGLRKRIPPENQNIILTTKWHMTSLVKRAIKACSPTQTLQVAGAGNKVSCVVIACKFPAFYVVTTSALSFGDGYLNILILTIELLKVTS